jgi:hypothetical protein
VTMLRAALAARLECVRGGLTDAEFAHLLDDVVRTAERFEQIEARHREGTTRVLGASNIETPRAADRTPSRRPEP